jgi:hypothetical protein
MVFGEGGEPKTIPRPTVLVFVPWLLLLLALVLGLFPPVEWVKEIAEVLR